MSQETLALETPVTDTEKSTPAAEPRLPRPAPRKKRWGDRKDGRRVRTAQPMAKMMAFIMKDRADAMNYFADELDVTETDAFCKQMIAEGYEGFIHLLDMEGEVEKSTLRYIIRDHDMEKFNQKKAVMQSAADFINAKYGEGTCVLTIRDSYFNMKQCIEPVMYVVERAKKAMAAVGMNPVEVPIRGGTDGARLSYEGLPCPNLCTGGENYHGRFEFIPVEDMEKCVNMLVQILTTVD